MRKLLFVPMVLFVWPSEAHATDCSTPPDPVTCLCPTLPVTEVAIGEITEDDGVFVLRVDEVFVRDGTVRTINLGDLIPTDSYVQWSSGPKSFLLVEQEGGTCCEQTPHLWGGGFESDGEIKSLSNPAPAHCTTPVDFHDLAALLVSTENCRADAREAFDISPVAVCEGCHGGAAPLGAALAGLAVCAASARRRLPPRGGKPK